MKGQLKTVCFLFLLISVFLLSGCEEKESLTVDNDLFGIWRSYVKEEKLIIFYPDGSYESHTSSGSWNIENDKIVITSDDDLTYKYDYFISKIDELHLTDEYGVTEVYIRYN